MKKRYYVLLILVTSCLIAFNYGDNMSILEELKFSSQKVIDVNQSLINKNKDGSISNKNFSKEIFIAQTNTQFEKMMSKEKWKITDLKGSHDYKKLGQALALYLAAGRIVIAKNQKLINKDNSGTPNQKGFYPAVFGRLTADEFLNRTGIKIKQTTTGKGMGPRNDKMNQPDEWETIILSRFESKGWHASLGFGQKITKNGKAVYRYMHPLSIKQACLTCHGDPKGEKDVSGFVKEGYKLNDVRGGISVLVPIE